MPASSPQRAIASEALASTAAYMLVDLPLELRVPTLAMRPWASSLCSTSMAWRSVQPTRCAVMALLA